MSDLNTRIQKYYNLNNHLSQVDSVELVSLLNKSKKIKTWDTNQLRGTNQIIIIKKAKLFVKRIPITDTEYKHLFSTKNRYRLPRNYYYGVDPAAAGAGVFRELAIHVKTTNWVLQGQIENFPLMYHYRIMPNPKRTSKMKEERQREFNKYWNNSKIKGKYIVDRFNSNYEAVLFLEYFPYTLKPWLNKNMDKLNYFVSEMKDTLSFLQKNGIIHFDVHWENIITDGNKPFLTDFGLALDKGFDLSSSERLFFKNNSYYDFGQFLFWIAAFFHFNFQKLSDAKKKKIICKYESGEKIQLDRPLLVLLKNIHKIIADGDMKLPKQLVDCIKNYGSIMISMCEFIENIRGKNSRITSFNNREIRRLLKKAGFCP